MQRKSSFPAFAAALAALVAGCEWTSTSSSDSWSGSYDAMNFAGTYRSSSSLTSSSGESDGTSTVTITAEPKGTANGTTVSGTLAHTPIVPSSVGIKVGGITYKDNGNQSFNSVAGEISYDSGVYSLDFGGDIKTGAVYASYTYYAGTTTAGTDAATADSTLSNISSITVSQSGQNLSMTTNTGLKMSGKFTAVRQTSGTEDSTVKTFNAQFQVSSSNGYTFVGTLNHDLSSGYCTLNGTITKGKAAADVQGTGPTYNAG